MANSRLLHQIFYELKIHENVAISRDVLDEAFPEPSEMYKAAMIFSYASQGKKMPSLGQEEQIEAFCRANNMTFRRVAGGDGVFSRGFGWKQMDREENDVERDKDLVRAGLMAMVLWPLTPATEIEVITEDAFNRERIYPVRRAKRAEAIKVEYLHDTVSLEWFHHDKFAAAMGYSPVCDVLVVYIPKKRSEP